MKVKVLILRTAGTNCDGETGHAFAAAGGDPQFLHINRLLERPALLEQFQILAIPGGFSYGDDIAAGKILANQIAQHLRQPLARFVAAGKPIIGICNGFQVLVKTDLLPGPLGGRTGQTATLTHNPSGRFIDRWVHLSPRSKKCVWTRGLGDVELPIAHGEGKFIPASDSVRQALWDKDQVAFVYVPAAEPLGNHQPPFNPNGSVDDIAGVCDATGLVLGLMPHPERHVSPLQHYAWTSRQPLPREGDGLQIFRNAVNHVQQSAGATA